jgi:hypothetical protein
MVATPVLEAGARKGIGVRVPSLALCDCGEIGRRARFRAVWTKHP